MAISTDTMTAAVRSAWSRIPPPPEEDLQYVAWGWGEEASRALVGIAPVDVDILSAGFLSCTPLFDLPAVAAAAYLGTYLLSLLHGLELQERTGLFHDVTTRAHLLSCLADEGFWQTVIRPRLPEECRRVLVEFASYLMSRRELLALSSKQADLIVSFAVDK